MAILLLHGFTGRPSDMAPLERALTDAGFSCVVPELAGHGQAAHALKNTHHSTWLHAARQALADMPTNEPRMVIGLSMGALLTTILATDYPDKVRAVGLLAPSFRLRRKGRIGTCLAYFGIQNLFQPGLLEFNHIRQQALGRIKDLKCPVLAAFGEQDRTIDVEFSRQQLPKHCTILSYPAAGHVLPLDAHRGDLFTQIIEFCRDQR